jgi:hypothetical protein
LLLNESAAVSVTATIQLNGKDDPSEHMIAQALPTAMGDSRPTTCPT